MSITKDDERFNELMDLIDKVYKGDQEAGTYEQITKTIRRFLRDVWYEGYNDLKTSVERHYDWSLCICGRFKDPLFDLCYHCEISQDVAYDENMRIRGQ